MTVDEDEDEPAESLTYCAACGWPLVWCVWDPAEGLTRCAGCGWPVAGSRL